MTKVDVRGFREQHKLSVEDLASRLGVSYRTVERWEQGKSKLKKRDTLALKALSTEFKQA